MVGVEPTSRQGNLKPSTCLSAFNFREKGRSAANPSFSLHFLYQNLLKVIAKTDSACRRSVVPVGRAQTERNDGNWLILRIKQPQQNEFRHLLFLNVLFKGNTHNSLHAYPKSTQAVKTGHPQKFRKVFFHKQGTKLNLFCQKRSFSPNEMQFN